MVPYKLTYDEITGLIGFVPQNSEDLLETEALSLRLNAFLKDTTSEGAILAKSKSESIKEKILTLHC